MCEECKRLREWLEYMATSDLIESCDYWREAQAALDGKQPPPRAEWTTFRG